MRDEEVARLRAMLDESTRRLERELEAHRGEDERFAAELAELLERSQAEMDALAQQVLSGRFDLDIEAHLKSCEILRKEAAKLLEDDEP